ncbi:MAG TPA: hydroxymethylbilane synthase [Myxococcaceae bacterium]|nr:hydroxymethylbilane synthase [Myxococcaceae bacterium]
MRPLRIATRKSPLALWQARHVAELVQRLAPGTEVSLEEMTTEGDRFLAEPLSRIGGKGLFVKEIEQALLDRRADVAVHSLKDMTSELAPGLCLAAVPTREDPRDALVSPGKIPLSRIPHGATLGTASLRRSCQLRERRPDLKIEVLRGNVQTRLRKVKESGMAGAVLALAGLRRLGLESEVSEVLEPEVSLPAVGQGALAIECRQDDAELREVLARLEDPTTRVAVTAERAFLARMQGGCTVPLAGYATLSAGQIHLRALVGRPDGTRVVRGERSGPAASAERLGRDLGEELWSRGGEEILREFGS